MVSFFCFFNDTATTEIYTYLHTLSLHDALPICKSVTALLREVLYNQPAQLLDSDADNKVVDADAALQVLGQDHVAFGYLTTTITVIDRDRAAVEEKVRAVERIVNGLGDRKSTRLNSSH